MPKLNSRQDAHIVEDADIGTTGVLASAEIPGDRLVSANIQATAAASYALDVSADGDNWFDAEEVYDQAEVDDATDLRDTFILGDRFLRVRVTSAAAAGETATVTIQVA